MLPWIEWQDCDCCHDLMTDLSLLPQLNDRLVIAAMIEWQICHYCHNWMTDLWLLPWLYDRQNDKPVFSAQMEWQICHYYCQDSMTDLSPLPQLYDRQNANLVIPATIEWHTCHCYHDCMTDIMTILSFLPSFIYRPVIDIVRHQWQNCDWTLWQWITSLSKVLGCIHNGHRAITLSLWKRWQVPLVLEARLEIYAPSGAHPSPLHSNMCHHKEFVA